MISTVYSHFAIAPHFHEQGGGKTSRSSFLRRMFHLNWDKAHLLSNIALIVAGLAYAFFMKLPPVFMFTLGSWGVVTVLLYGKAIKTRPSQSLIDDLQEKYQSEKEKNRLLNEKLEGKMKAEGVRKELLEEVKTARAKLDYLNQAIKNANTRLNYLKSDIHSRR